MTNVLHVLGSLRRGGVETWLMQLLRHIDREKYQLDFCCLSGQEGDHASQARLLGSEIFTIELTKTFPSFHRRFSGLLQVKGYDVVHSHVHHFSGYVLRQSAKLRVPTRIAHSHSAPNEDNVHLVRLAYLRQMEKWIEQYATVGLGVSTEAMVALFGADWQSDQRWNLMYCGIDVGSFKFSDNASQTIRSEYGIPADAQVVGHVGNFSEAKNHRFLLEIARTVTCQRDDIWFLLVGDGELRSEIEKQVRQDNIQRVVLAGSQSNVADFLSAIDLFLFPSKWEGLPLSVIEAQANGLHCLCSDVVTREVAVVPTAVRFMSLDCPATDWAQTCLSMLSKTQLKRIDACKAVAASPFAIQSSVRSLVQIYGENPGGNLQSPDQNGCRDQSR